MKVHEIKQILEKGMARTLEKKKKNQHYVLLKLQTYSPCKKLLCSSIF